jgi:hypothetical protein
MTPFDTYKEYLAFKQHFTREKYDYFRYAGKSKTSLQSFHKRKDRYFFEKMSRKYSDEQIKDFFLANFSHCTNPHSLWIGEIIRTGEENYNEWKKIQQSLFYQFKQQSEMMLSEYNLNKLFDCSRQHPPILRLFLGGEITVETLVIWDKIFCYSKNFDKKLLDPIWEAVSLKIKKYKPFLNIDIFKYKNMLKEKVLECVNV